MARRTNQVADHLAGMARRNILESWEVVLLEEILLKHELGISAPSYKNMEQERTDLEMGDIPRNYICQCVTHPSWVILGNLIIVSILVTKNATIIKKTTNLYTTMA
ncbi:hypothetical protein SAY87_020669 [Trapa incisa]|uniref:Uncharacterized protein n=1 Tax=Trapa incisa TaxID=236973 RepID=A0AAN7JR61_9MYRT|nr:hypothetical protein SAY87_020669 [Trapa incisa]